MSVTLSGQTYFCKMTRWLVIQEFAWSITISDLTLPIDRPSLKDLMLLCDPMMVMLIHHRSPFPPPAFCQVALVDCHHPFTPVSGKRHCGREVSFSAMLVISSLVLLPVSHVTYRACIASEGRDSQSHSWLRKRTPENLKSLLCATLSHLNIPQDRRSVAAGSHPRDNRGKNTLTSSFFE